MRMLREMVVLGRCPGQKLDGNFSEGNRLPLGQADNTHSSTPMFCGHSPLTRLGLLRVSEQLLPVPGLCFPGAMPEGAALSVDTAHPVGMRATWTWGPRAKALNQIPGLLSIVRGQELCWLQPFRPQFPHQCIEEVEKVPQGP